MIDIHYKIEFFNEWHTGSGLSAGADVDDLVIKDKDNLPFVPGKTIKGLLRQAVEEILEFKGEYDNKRDDLVNTFGLLSEKKTLPEDDDADTEIEELKRGQMFCTNASLSPELASQIQNEDVSEFLYRSVASTAIAESGVAKQHSLRRMQTTIPVVLYGELLSVSSNLEKDIEDALSYIKRLGVNRHRGLGRCQFSVIKKEEVKA